MLKTECGKEYIEAARISGASNFRIVTRHLIPNVLPQFIVYFTTGIATAIMSVSALLFLGLVLLQEHQSGALCLMKRETVCTLIRASLSIREFASLYAVQDSTF